jgi:hypothetical protein
MGRDGRVLPTADRLRAWWPTAAQKAMNTDGESLRALRIAPPGVADRASLARDAAGRPA